MARILLIDDDETFRAMLRMTLVKMGHEVREACDGKEGLAVFEESAPHIVMTDIVMPNQEGLETIGALKRRQPAVQVIGMSGGGVGSAAAYLRIAKGMGADGVLEKPFSHDAMSRVLGELLGSSCEVNAR
jgi:DNA-binding NtrC family response regulator